MFTNSPGVGHFAVRVGGFVALLATPAALLARTLAARGLSTGAAGTVGALALTGGIAVALEWGRLRDWSATAFPWRDGLADAAAVVGGAVLTHAAAVHLGLGPVLGSALVGLLAGVVAPRVDAAAYCGSFVGMASSALFPGVGYLVAAGALTGAGYVATRRVFAGYGGKLGTLALFGCATTAALSAADYGAATPLPWADARLVVPVAAVAAVATVLLNRRLGLGAVVGSALVGVVAGVAFPVVAPAVGGTLAAAAYCASFVGMSSTERLPEPAHFALAGAVSGVVFVAATAALPGAGGKLGTVAFVSCVALAGLERLLAAPRTLAA